MKGLKSRSSRRKEIGIVECRSDQRDFLRWAGLGTLGLGFGVSVFAGIFQWAEGSAGEQKYRVPRIKSSQFCLRVEGLVENPYRRTMEERVGMKDKTVSAP